jgi:hypothetical protein
LLCVNTKEEEGMRRAAEILAEYAGFVILMTFGEAYCDHSAI